MTNEIKHYQRFIDDIKKDGFLSSKNIFRSVSKSSAATKLFNQYCARLKELTFFAEESMTKNERFRLVKFNITAGNYLCPVCNKPRVFNTGKHRWFLTCGYKDADHLIYLKKEAKKNHEKIMLAKYGVKSAQQLPEIQDKTKKTNIKKYGVAYPIQSIDVQTTYKDNFIKKYGVSNPMLSPKIKTTYKDNFIKKYGVSNPMQSSIIVNQYMDSRYPGHVFFNNNFDTGSAKDFFGSFFKNNTLDIQKLLSETGYKGKSSGYKLLKKFDINLQKGSTMEQEIVDFIKSIDPNTEIIQNSRQIIKPKELDIYLPEYNLAIEYNGLMFHSQGTSPFSMFNTPTKNKNIHLTKTKACEAQDIQLLHIFENEWLDEHIKDIWKSVIRNKIRKNKIKIGARKCQFATTEQLLKESKSFLDDNHLQGSGAIGSIRYGLTYNGELVALMTFSKSRFGSSDFELVRFAPRQNWTVMGAASKLFKAFLKDNPNKTIVSYANRRWSDGGLYNNLGFKLKHIAAPNYFYFKVGSTNLQSRNMYQKHKLKDKLDTFDALLTEQQNMFKNGYRRIFDSGNYVFEYQS